MALADTPSPRAGKGTSRWENTRMKNKHGAFPGSLWQTFGSDLSFQFTGQFNEIHITHTLRTTFCLGDGWNYLEANERFQTRLTRKRGGEKPSNSWRQLPTQPLSSSCLRGILLNYSLHWGPAGVVFWPNLIINSVSPKSDFTVTLLFSEKGTGRVALGTNRAFSYSVSHTGEADFYSGISAHFLKPEEKWSWSDSTSKQCRENTGQTKFNVSIWSNFSSH